MNNISRKDFDITKFSTYKNIQGQYTEDFIKACRCVKLEETEKEVSIAVSEKYIDKIELLNKVHFPKRLEIINIHDSDFVEFIGSFVDSTSEILHKEKSSSNEYHLEDINCDAPVVNIINGICLEAIRKKASDIHIQVTQNQLKVRLRLDGVLQTVRELDKGISESLVSRVKVMSGLNVMESRLCQDGRMSVQIETKKLDFRVSIVPSVKGQNIVLRLFNADDQDFSLDEIGFSKENLNRIKTSLRIPHGLILATGPTGSGKTTTLHSMLKELDKEHLKIVTIEDPVEKEIDGIEQIQVNEEIGLTFENILRRILRQDPDVIMVGEIRDKETAELAVRSALTGHLILSTLHTNDCVSSITRLKNLGIESYLIAGVLRTCIAQRLVRKTCKDCKGKGCSICNYTGYKGRTAVSEVLTVDKELANLIENKALDSEIEKYLLKQSFIPLSKDAELKVKKGITTKNEILREGLI